MSTLSNFYKSDKWLDFKQILTLERTTKAGLMCEHCGKPIVKPYDCIGHHVIELTETNVNDVMISLNPKNVKLVHHKCHNRIHERFGFYKPKVYIVYGSPCSGKTTWVNEVARPDDLIIDMDRIWECLCLSDREHKPPRLKTNVFNVRDCLIEQVKLRMGMWRAAYVIGGYALATDRQRLADQLGAELVYIETDKETCLSRATSNEWVGFINDWWDKYTE